MLIINSLTIDQRINLRGAIAKFRDAQSMYRFFYTTESKHEMAEIVYAITDRYIQNVINNDPIITNKASSKINHYRKFIWFKGK